MAPKQKQQIQTAIRLPPELLKRFDEHAEFMSRVGGIQITRAGVLRLAATEGMSVIEAKRKKR